MNRTLLTLTLAAAAQLVAAEEKLASLAPFDLVRQGTAACSIVIAANPSPAARLAALELQYHVLKITGADLLILPDSDRVEGRRILAGESAATRELQLRNSDFKPQEYLIGFRPDTIILMGRDWEDTPANRKIQGRSTTDETLQQSRHRIDYWKAVGRPERSTGEMELPGVYDDQGTCLAVSDRMEELGGYIAQAEKLAGTTTERPRVALWRHALWDWMRAGRDEYRAQAE